MGRGVRRDKITAGSDSLTVLAAGTGRADVKSADGWSRDECTTSAGTAGGGALKLKSCSWCPYLDV